MSIRINKCLGYGMIKKRKDIEHLDIPCKKSMQDFYKWFKENNKIGGMRDCIERFLPRYRRFKDFKLVEALTPFNPLAHEKKNTDSISSPLHVIDNYDENDNVCLMFLCPDNYKTHYRYDDEIDYYESEGLVDNFTVKSLIDRSGIFPYEGYTLRRKYKASDKMPEFVFNSIDSRFQYPNLFKSHEKTTTVDPIHTYYHCTINPLIVAYIYYLETVLNFKVLSNDEEIELLDPMICTYWR